MVFTTKEAASYLNLSESYLVHLRCYGATGEQLIPPPFVKLGQGRKGIRYLKSDLDAWLQELPRYGKESESAA